MASSNPKAATPRAFGEILPDRQTYRPLDTATVRICPREHGATQFTLRVCDPDHREYAKLEGDAANDPTLTFAPVGKLGVHYIFLTWNGDEKYSRYTNFRLDVQTTVETGDRDFDELFPYTREHMQLGRRAYDQPDGRMVGYISADTVRFDGIWLRDWIYGMDAFRFWEPEMRCGLDRFLDAQNEQGMIPDGIHRDGDTWRVGLESDVEYILVLGVFGAWRATGDEAWVRGTLPKLEKALAYVRSDPRHWDQEHQLVKRQHSCDTWDFDFNGFQDAGDERHVIATCDQSGYYAAYRAMAHIHRAVGDAERAAFWDTQADDTKAKATQLLWDGSKFAHHLHLSPIDHGDFDESQQLAMGNTWAMTRGLADGEQSRAIIDEYRRRHEATGDAYPWWSLHPGYPNELGYFRKPHLQQGGYANGGLMPWVGGELCRAAFWYGREDYGVQLFRQWADHVRRTGGAQVWYWTDGEPGHRTTNEVNYAGWGMAQWIGALFEGAAGVIDMSGLFRTVHLTPRWPAANIDHAYVACRYPGRDEYIAYRWHLDREHHRIELDISSTAAKIQPTIMLPTGCEITKCTWADQPVSTQSMHVGETRYIKFDESLANSGRLTLHFAISD